MKSLQRRLMSLLALITTLSLSGCFLGDLQFGLTPEFLVNFTAISLSEEIGEDVWWVYMKVDETTGTRFILVRPTSDVMPFSSEIQEVPEGEEDVKIEYPRRVVDFAIAGPCARLVIASAAEFARYGPDSKVGIRAILLPVDEAEDADLSLSDGCEEFVEAMMTQGWQCANELPGVWRSQESAP